MTDTPRISAGLGMLYLLPVLACVDALCWLTLRRVPLAEPWPGVAALVLTLLALVGLGLLAWLLERLNPAAMAAHGPSAALVAVSSGMLMLIPFTVLALIAELALGWSAAQTFGTAGIMTAAAGIGVEMSRLGPGRPANGLLPALAAMLFVGVWIATNLVLQGVSR